MSSRAELSADLICAAICETPTEAHLMDGLLRSAGLVPHIADANIVQAHPFITHAVGGVRVLVPASQADAARKVIAEYHAGAFMLEGEDSSPETHQTPPSPLFNPDRAVVLSFLLTPAFGAAIHTANNATLGFVRRPLQWAWFLFLANISTVTIAALHRANPGPFVVFRASLALSLITIVWYVLVGSEQSRKVLKIYGPKYGRKSLLGPALAAAVASLALGWALSEFA